MNKKLALGIAQGLNTQTARTESRIFDMSTLAGIKAAEQYQQKLYNQFDKVIVTPIGLCRVMIAGRP